MKSEIRLSTVSSVFVLATVVLLGGVFVACWIRNSVQAKRLAVQESRVEKEMAKLSAYRNWTLDYCRISLALDIVSKKKMSSSQKRMLTAEIWKISRNYGLDPLLIPAIVFQESHGNPMARGRFRSGAESGAYGLMQLKVPTAQTIGKRFGIRVESADDLMRPEVSVVVGSAYLMRLIGRYGNLKHAIIAYNLGQGGVDSKIQRNVPVPTAYYEDVLAKYRKLQRLVDERMGKATQDF